MMERRASGSLGVCPAIGRKCVKIGPHPGTVLRCLDASKHLGWIQFHQREPEEDILRETVGDGPKNGAKTRQHVVAPMRGVQQGDRLMNDLLS